MKDFFAACWQCEVTSFSAKQNLTRLDGVFSELSRRECRLLVLPEMWSCGFSPADLGVFALETPLILEAWRERCRRYSMVMVGSMPEIDGARLFNTSYVVDVDGSVVARYRKMHLFSPNDEAVRFTAGQKPVVCDTTVGRLGIMICYDLRFPELSRHLASAGAQILCVSALWPQVRVSHWNLLLRARALENQVFAVGCNGWGKDGALLYGGNSAVISPTGESLWVAGEGEKCGGVGIDLTQIDAFRQAIPCWVDRRPDLYRKFLDQSGL
jgi:omega-amidase